MPMPKTVQVTERNKLDYSQQREDNSKLSVDRSYSQVSGHRQHKSVHHLSKNQRDAKSNMSLGFNSKTNISSIVHFNEADSESEIGSRGDYVIQKKLTARRISQVAPGDNPYSGRQISQTYRLGKSARSSIGDLP